MQRLNAGVYPTRYCIKTGVGNMVSKIITIPTEIPRVQKLTISKIQWTQLH
ncbi:hypothetical protein [Moorena producens]|uniref:hypothetical protein n=1 Tax=Moorena producens TaxID=1155739 RepID=UPI003C784CB6